MSDHLSPAQIEGYRRRVLLPAELLAVDDHLSGCPGCRGRISGAEERLASAVAAWQAELHTARTQSDHLSYEQLSACVDDRLDEADREVVKSHLDLCASCAKELRDLRALIEPAPARAVETVTPASLREKFLAFWHWPAPWAIRPLIGAAIATVVLASSAAGFLVLRWVRSTVPRAVADRQTAPATTSRAPDAPNIVLALNIGGGRQLTLDGQGRISGLNAYPETLRGTIQKTVQTQRLTTPPILATLIGRQRTLRDPLTTPAPFDLLSPTGTVVPGDTPTFHWQSWTGANGYTLQILDAKQDEVARSPLVSGTEWTAERPLARGATYTWQVTAVRNGEEFTAATASGRRAKFHVLEAAEATELAHARFLYGDSPLILGILDVQFGLLDDAQLQFDALAQANRDASPATRALTEKLLDRLQALRSPRQ